MGIALLAGCTTPEPSTGFSASPLAFPAGIEIAPAEAPPAGGPYEFTTAFLENGSLQHPRLDAAVEATIHWWNVDDEVHSVISDDGMFAGSGPIPPNAEFSVTFLREGDYRYHCRYHAGMTGIVVVR